MSDCLEYTKSGLRDLKAVPKADRDRIRAALEHLRVGMMNLDAVPLTGHPGYYRLRCGNWRVVYKHTKDHEALKQVLTVVHVVNRKDLARTVRRLEAA